MLRFWKLTFQSLRWDEIYTARAAAQQTIAQTIFAGAVNDKHPPGHVLFLHFWARLFGDSEWSLRLPSVLVGVAAVYAVYRLGRVLASERVGLVAAGLTAVSQMPVYYSQDARAYVFLLLGCTLCALGIVALQDAHAAGRTRWLLRLGVLATLSATSYLHYFGLLFVAMLGVYALALVLRKKLAFADWAIPFLSAALLYLPWLNVLLRHAAKRKSWMSEPSGEVMGGMFGEMMSRAPAAWWTVFVLAVSLHLYDSLQARRTATRSESKARLLSPSVLRLFGWLAIPTVIGLFISLLFVPVLSDRNLVIVLPALFILGAMALAKIDCRLFRGLPVAATVGVLGLLFQLVVVEGYYSTLTKRQYRAVAAYLVKATRNSEEPAFIAEDRRNAWSRYYWRARPNREAPVDGTGQPLSVISEPKRLLSLLEQRKPRRFWVVNTTVKSRNGLPRRFEGYRRGKAKQFHKISVSRFDRIDRHENDAPLLAIPSPPPR